MFDYLQKFDQLPEKIQASVSSPAAMAVISDLEKKYQVDLAALVIKVAIKEIPLADLPSHLVSELGMTPDNARRLTADLKERLFFSIANYLGYNPSYSTIVPDTKPVADTFYLIKKVIREAGISFSINELNQRLESILNTYFKGVRSRIDTRLALNKGVASGGLGLDHKVIDQLFLLIDQAREKPILTPVANTPEKEEAKDNHEALEKVRAAYQKAGVARDIPYDLKTAILKRQEAVAASQKLLKDGAQPALEAPELIPLTAPKPEEKEAVPEKREPETPKTVSTIPVTPIPPIPPVVPIKPTPAPTPAPVTAPTSQPISKPTPIVKADSVSASPLLPPKEGPRTIEQPPKKKPNIFKKIFSKSKKEVAPLPTTPTPPPVPVGPASVASLRQQAQQNINNPHLRPAPAATTPLKTQPQPVSPLSKPATPSKPIPSKPTQGPVTSVSAPKPIESPQESTSPKPKTLGPVEELHYLELVNFRRLGASPKEAAGKIEKKIRTLETEGYDKMVEAILAWRSGEINNIYVKMAKEALQYQITLKQVADKYQDQKNPQYLTWEEIEELIALNHRLAF